MQRYSCKKLGKEEAFRRAQQMMLTITYEALRNIFPHSFNEDSNFISNIQLNRSIKSPRYSNRLIRSPDELIYEYEGPFNPVLIYRKWSRVRTINA